MTTLTKPADQDVAQIAAEMGRYGSEFAKTYANHTPMVVYALQLLGGSPARMRDYFETYRDAHKLFLFMDRVAPVDAATWTDCLGQREREADLRDFFRGEVARLGIEGALGRYLPTLVPGVGASALHALMRLAYALIRDDADEVAVSLGYWAATYLPLPPATGAAPITDDPATVLAKVAAIPVLRTLPMHELLWDNMREVGAQPAFAPVVDWLEFKGDSVERLAAASLALFAATMDFCALHAVTGMHWVRILLPYCPQPEPLLRHFWQVVAALMGNMGFPALPDAATVEAWRRLPAPEWDVIKAAAVRSNDEHDLSLVFSAVEEEKIYGDRLYRVAAARRMGLIEDYV